MRLFPLLVPAGSDTQIQYNNGGLFGGVSALTWNDVTKALTIGSAAVIGPNSAVFRPTADSTTFFQILDADGGTPILNVDSTNERVGIGIATPQFPLDTISNSTGEAFIGSFRSIANSSNGILEFGGRNAVGTNILAQIRIQETGGVLGFYTGSNTSGTLGTVAFQVLANKHTLFGTATDSGNLCVKGSGICYLSLDSSDNLGSQISLCSGGGLRGSLFVDGGSRFRINGKRNSNDSLLLNDTDAGSIILVNGGGNVLIGTGTVPSTILEIVRTEPYITIHNSTHEDIDGGRESRLNFKGEQSGGEETTLVRIEVSHDGAADDEKGKVVISTNDGSDTNTPTTALTIDSGQNTTFAKFDQWSVTAGIAAVTPGVQGDGTLTTTVNEVSTVANANDAVTLPVAVAGRHVVICNNGANTLEIWPASGDNAGAGVNIAVTLVAGSNVHYITYDTTNWEIV